MNELTRYRSTEQGCTFAAFISAASPHQDCLPKVCLLNTTQTIQSHSGLSSHSCRQGCIVWPTQSIIYCSYIADLPPFIEEKILPTCSKAMGISRQALLSERVWDLFPEIHRICSSRSLHSEAVLFHILQVFPLFKLLPMV